MGSRCTYAGATRAPIEHRCTCKPQLRRRLGAKLGAPTQVHLDAKSTWRVMLERNCNCTYRCTCSCRLHACVDICMEGVRLQIFAFAQVQVDFFWLSMLGGAGAVAFD